MSTIQNVKELFVPNRIGRLLKIEENEQTRYQFEVWFEYTRQAMMQLREGVLLAAKNFATNQNETHYSTLEIVSIMPIHYALGENVGGYPGFVMEAARNLAADWIFQEDRSQEDTTIIRCIAAPTGLEILESIRGRSLSQEQALPMVGSDVRILTNEAAQIIVNREISPTDHFVFEGGKWLVDNQIPVYVRAEDFIRVHFGIFGFTGVGKSNLVSTYVATLIHASENNRHPIKIVLFDLMGEYTVLLLDQVIKLTNAYILAIDEYALPRRVVSFLCGDTEDRENAIRDLLNTCLYPKPLYGMRSEFRPAFESLLEGNKIRIYQKPKRTIRTFLQDNVEKLTQGNLGGSRAIINTIIENLETLRENIISPQLVQGIITAIDQLISGRLRQATLEGVGDTAISHIRQKILQNIQIADKGLTQTAINNLREFRSALQAELRSTQREYPPNVALSIDEIIENLNNPNCSTLSIIQSHDPDYLREFAYELGLKLFENRRINGIISPLVSFIFDEADEFIPGQYEKESSYAKSAYIAEMLARRGRKFGLGIGICTQRTRYLKTSVMAQPHTYLISKMPRITDRQAVQEAFGLSEEMFRQTFKFAPGDWLIASYDAIGIKGVPIPIHAKDANERIKNFVKSINKKD